MERPALMPYWWHSDTNSHGRPTPIPGQPETLFLFPLLPPSTLELGLGVRQNLKMWEEEGDAAVRQRGQAWASREEGSREGDARVSSFPPCSGGIDEAAGAGSSEAGCSQPSSFP